MAPYPRLICKNASKLSFEAVFAINREMATQSNNKKPPTWPDLKKRVNTSRLISFAIMVKIPKIEVLDEEKRFN